MYFIHNDHLGTPQVVTDANQSVVWQADYQPFGEVDVTTNLIDQDARFPGQYVDEATGLHYNYFRDYDPTIGRYIQSDPIGILHDYSDPQLQIVTQIGTLRPENPGFDLNHMYGYVSQNPLSFIDPYGLFEGCHRVSGGAGFDDYYVCPNGGPDFSTGENLAFSPNANNTITQECIDEHIFICTPAPSANVVGLFRSTILSTVCSIQVVNECSCTAD